MLRALPHQVTLDGLGLAGVPYAASCSRVVMCVGMLAAVMGFEARRGTAWARSRTWMRGIYRWNRAKQGKVRGEGSGLVGAGRGGDAPSHIRFQQSSQR